MIAPEKKAPIILRVFFYEDPEHSLSDAPREPSTSQEATKNGESLSGINVFLLLFGFARSFTPVKISVGVPVVCSTT